MLKDFRAFQMAKELRWACENLRLSRSLKEQLLDASASVTQNLAEGSGKQTVAEQRRFYGMALGSLRECQAIIEMARLDSPEIMKILDPLGAMIFSLCRGRTNGPRIKPEENDIPF